MTLDLKEALGTWYPVLHTMFASPQMEYIGRVLGATRDLQPKLDSVFRAFSLTPLDTIRVLIIGQDPYPFGEADGLAFSSKFKPRPYSLEIIFEELEREGLGTRSTNGLDDWSEQGVMLLNVNLTTNLGKVGAHSNIGWEYFTGQVLHMINEEAIKENRLLIVAAWGDVAKSLVKKYMHRDMFDKILLLQSPHPAAQRHGYKFLGCGHFDKINEYLVHYGLKPIIWV